MSMLPIDETKFTFLVADSDPEAVEILTSWLKKTFPNSIIFGANDGTEATMKMKNATPTALITDLDLPKISGAELIKNIVKDKGYDDVQIVIVSSIPEEECYVEEIVSGRVSFLAKPCEQETFTNTIRKAVARAAQRGKEFKLRALDKGEVLFHEGDPPGNIYLVKKGSLSATKNNHQVGVVHTNEFVGEMSHISGGNRTATVTAAEDCELIEIPSGSFDLLLFSKPAWSKALMKTLTNRLMSANNGK